MTWPSRTRAFTSRARSPPGAAATAVSRRWRPANETARIQYRRDGGRSSRAIAQRIECTLPAVRRTICAHDRLPLTGAECRGAGDDRPLSRVTDEHVLPHLGDELCAAGAECCGRRPAAVSNANVANRQPMASRGLESICSSSSPWAVVVPAGDRPFASPCAVMLFGAVASWAPPPLRRAVPACARTARTGAPRVHAPT